MSILENIDRIAREKHITHRKICDVCGLVDTSYRAWMNGKSESYRKYLPEIAKLLGVTVEYLTGAENRSEEFYNAYLNSDEKIKKAVEILLGFDPA